MCGLTGFLDTGSSGSHERLTATVNLMAETILHRGPDDGGAWVDERAGIALGSRRLAIVDLSAEGHQPMHSASGRYVIAFNGEIYNFPAIREELEALGAQFRGHSDTEVLLAAVEQWGLERSLKKAVGMFALALWDRKEKVLSLSRDRLGEKPLYYGWSNGAFLFGSELKTLRAHPAFKGEVDRGSLALFLRYGYVPAPHSIYQGISKLPPASILTIEALKGPSSVAVASYWSAKRAAEDGVAHPFQGTESEAKDELDRLLRESVKGQMIADVPVGAFLSGGIDSSSIVALMQAQASMPVRTFTIGFREAEFDEAGYAHDVARHLGTDHTELYVSPEEAREVIPRLPKLYDEPFADPSQIPTFALAQMTRRFVTVSLSGDGGDELFGGYERYFRAERIRKTIAWVPKPMRVLANQSASAIPAATWDRGIGLLRKFSGDGVANDLSGHRIHVLADILGHKSSEDMYRSFMSTWKDPVNIVKGSSEPDTVQSDPAAWAKVDNFSHHMMYVDLVDYLPDDLMVKVDRASMGVSLEARAPFLDHRVVEFAWKLPLEMKIRDGQSKWLLRRVLDDYVPDELIDRPKMGFGIPLAEWLRGPLREWAETLLDESRLRDEGFLDPAPIRHCWQEHLSATRDWKHQLWNVLMFQAWLEDSRSTLVEPSESVAMMAS